MKKSLILLLVLALLATVMLLAGCDEKKEDDKEGAEATQAATTTAATTTAATTAATTDVNTPVSGEAAFIGTWQMTPPEVLKEQFSNGFVEGFVSSAGEELAGYMDVNKIDLGMTMTFAADGSLTMEMDADALYNSALAMLKDGMTKYFEDMAAAAGTTVEEMLKAQGMTSLDELFDAAFAELSKETLVAAVGQTAQTGTWSLVGEKLTLTMNNSPEEVTYTFKNASTLEMVIDGEAVTLTK